MSQALYTPGLGYYANDRPKFGALPASGSDFATAPGMSPLFGRALAAQVAEALDATGADTVWEFGAGTGELAAQLLAGLGERAARYRIIELSASLRARQRERLADFGDRVEWLDALPAAMSGVVVGNEVLDAMPVKLLVRLQGRWHERGVTLHDGRLTHADQATDLRPPVDIPGSHDYLTEIHPQAEAFIGTLADRLQVGAAFFFDYGFPEHEYFHPQRDMGTVMCHRAHQADADALADVGLKDITAHVNFTGVALAGQDAGLRVAGYTSQGRFLLNSGLLDGMDNAPLQDRVMVQKLVNEHEMGELFKVLAFATAGVDEAWVPGGFSAGDRMHTL
ncbi:MAG: class I SAM-dependent methyltransferase [Comamonadaceae bacterium]|nr:MAG: class I SAM-dependent methyltransferase [Comamonadaceae bacterium]